MERIRVLENKLAQLYKGAPALSKETKESLASFWPYVMVILAILQIWAAWALWRLFDRTNAAADYVNSFLQSYGTTTVGLSSGEKVVIYLGIVLLLVEAALLLMAYGPLQKRERRGWDIIFLVSVIQVAYAVISVFVYGNGVGSLLINLIGAAIGFYFLFQIRDHYKGSRLSLPKKA